MFFSLEIVSQITGERHWLFEIKQEDHKNFGRKIIILLHNICFAIMRDLSI